MPSLGSLQFGGERDPLRLATGQLGRGLSETEVSQSDFSQRGQAGVASDPGMMLGVRPAGSTRPPLPGVWGLRYAAASLGKVHVGGCFRRHHRLRRSPI